MCENNANSTCLTTPLSTTTGYTSYIVPLEARIDLGHVLSNDPRPHFIHQSNLSEGRIVYPVLEKVLDTYRGLYADNTPVVNLAQREIGAEFQRRAAWNTAVTAGQVTGYRIGDTVTVSAPSGVQAEATMPTGTTQKLAFGSSAFGTAYAGSLSGWVKPGSLQSTVTLKLTAAQTPVAPAAAAAATVQPLVALAAKTVVPSGTATAVPAGPSDTTRTRAKTLVPGSGVSVPGKAAAGKAAGGKDKGKASGGTAATPTTKPTGTTSTSTSTTSKNGKNGNR